MKMKTIDDILNSVPDKIYIRGSEYYRSDKILDIYQNGEGVITAEVEGSYGDIYTVNIEVDENENVKYFYCDCPYDYSPVCKHTVAVLLAIQNGDFSKNPENEISLKEKLGDLSKEELIDILSALADADFKIREKINNRLNMLTSDEYDISGIIESIISEYEDRSGFIDYYSCYDMCMEIVEAANDELKYFKTDRSLKHIKNTLYINRKAIEIIDYCDDSDGGISVILGTVKENLYNMCETVYSSKNDDDCNECLNMLCAEAESEAYKYWFDEKIELTEIALIFSQYNPDLFLQKTNELIKLCENDNKYYLDSAVLLKYKLLSKIENQNEADKFLLGYIDCDGVREYAVKKHIKEKSYDKAEKLCLDKLKEKDFSYTWRDLLSEIYEKSGQIDKQLDIELKGLLNGRAEKYDNVKRLSQKLGIWDNEYEGLLLKLSDVLSPHSYAEILKSESEYEKLLDLIKKNEYLLEIYFKTIVSKYPKETYTMYSDYIIKTAKTASMRSQYAQLCKKIGDLYKYGGKAEAIQTANFLKKEYKRKPALCDEINKISKHFK